MSRKAHFTREVKPIRKGSKKSKLGSKATSPDAAMDALARLLTARERSVEEARRRLLKKGFQESAVCCVIQRAENCGLLDDQRFARGFIKDKSAANWGKNRIEKELRCFGITIASLDGYPEDFFTEEEQIKRATLALKKHRTRSKNPEQAAYRYLMSRGFDSDIASCVIKGHVCDTEGS